jgi:hypothetical protein
MTAAMTILPSAQRVSGSPCESRPETRPAFYEVVEGGKVLLVKNLDARCEQKLVAIWRPGIVGTWKTHGVVLIQPEVMRPDGVAKCDSLYTLAVRLPDDASIAALQVFNRGDAYAEPGGKAPLFEGIPGLAIRHAAGFSFLGEKVWRFFRLMQAAVFNPKVIYQKGPVLMTEDEARQEWIDMGDAAQRHNLIARAERFDWSGSHWNKVW